MIGRREFIAGLGGVAAWPLGARAQQSERVRRIGALIGWSDSDAYMRSYVAAFLQELARLGWMDGGNARIEQRWINSDIGRTPSFAKELVELRPDVIFSVTTPATAALQRETRAIPIVFAAVADPVGSGFIASLQRPGGNITGLISIEDTLGGKWLDLLVQIAPRITRAAAMFNPDIQPLGGAYYLRSFEAAARSLKVEPIITPVHSDAEIDSAINSLGREPGGGLVVISDSFMAVHRGAVISSAARNNVPAIYEGVSFVKAGGLLSYGADYADLLRRGAEYVDRILRGEKPADLPVQLPVKFVMGLNVKAARTLGLTVPSSVWLGADEVIE